jgi:RNA polymerase sigma-70 factor (ECF subfamily)
VDDAWLPIDRAGVEEVENISRWLTTVAARVCLSMLRSRHSRHEEPMKLHVPDRLITHEDEAGREHELLLAGSVGLTRQMVLDIFLPNGLRSCFTTCSTSARRQVRGVTPNPDADLAGQRQVAGAFFTTARG